MGGPGCGKSTLARERAKQLGVLVLCTDTPEQARATGRNQDAGVLYAPSSLGNDWSGLSAFIAEDWLELPGPFVIEGVALVRALRKWHAAHPGSPPPCDQILWCEIPHITLGHGQLSMLTGHDTMLQGLMDDWEGFADIVQEI